MGALRGAALGALGLIVLDRLVGPGSSRGAAAVSGATSGISHGVLVFLDPAHPLIADRSTSSTTSAGGSSSASVVSLSTPAATPAGGPPSAALRQQVAALRQQLNPTSSATV